MKKAPRINVVAACTDRKRATAVEPVRLRDVAAGPDRVEAWWKRLASQPVRLRADELYVGDHWSIVRDLVSLANRRGFDGQLWVASAGYGLVPSDAPLANYSATLSASTPAA